MGRLWLTQVVDYTPPRGPLDTVASSARISPGWVDEEWFKQEVGEYTFGVARRIGVLLDTEPGP